MINANNPSAAATGGSRHALRGAAPARKSRVLIAAFVALMCVAAGGFQTERINAAATDLKAALGGPLFASGFEAEDLQFACGSASGRDRDGDGLVDPTCITATTSPDPATIATPIDPTVPADFGTATTFIYQHPTPVQHGMLPNVIEDFRVAVLRGEIRDENGSPLEGVLVRVLNHPEVGYTYTRADGMFDVVVNGGSEVVLDYRKPGYLPAQRSAVAPWRDWEWVPDATLVPIDTVVTRIVTGGQMPRQLIRSSVVTDGDGTREAVLLVPPAITAELRMHDGSTQVMTELNVRATEYTVGERGPDRMPAALPPTTAYTYAVDFSADEAFAANARSVEFNQPLAFYLDNFLGAPVGVAIPVGFLDARLASWLPSDDGRVVKILAISGGLADLDIDGSGTAADAAALAALGIDLGERTQLAQIYPVGKELWRTPISHFTPWDCNFPYAPNPDDEPPPEGTDDFDEDCGESCGLADEDPTDVDDDVEVDEDPDTCRGSLIRCQPGSLQESIPVAGTGLSLVYHSERVPGLEATFASLQLKLKITRDVIPPNLQAASVDVVSLGKRYRSDFPSPSPNLLATIALDPTDAYGRLWSGARTWRATLRYLYPMVYFWRQQNNFERAWAQFYASGNEGSFARGTITYELARTWESRSRNISTRTTAADWDATGLGFGGWSLSGHHVFDRDAWKLYLGDGEQQRVALPGKRGMPIAQTLIQRYGPADLQRASRFAFAADGGLWVLARSEGSPVPGSNGVWRYGFDGSRQLVVDLCSEAALDCVDEDFGYAGPDVPRDIAVDSRGIAYVAAGSQVFEIDGDGQVASRFDGSALPQACVPRRIHAWNDRAFFTCGAMVFSLWRDGQITHLAGGGNQTGVGVAPRDFAFGALSEIAADLAGNLYVVDTTANALFRIRNDGAVERAAGNGSTGSPASGAMAAEAPLGVVRSLGILPNGNPTYATGAGDGRLLEIRGDGRTYTVAGGGDTGIGELAGEQSLSAELRFDVADVGFLGDGSVAFLQSNPNGELRKGSVGSVMGVIASSHYTAFNGYNEDAQDTRRVVSRDGAMEYEFDQAGRHLRTRDVVTGAMHMTFSYNSDGYLASMTDGDGNQVTIQRNTLNRATALVAQDGQQTVLEYDSTGRLSSVVDPVSRRWGLSYLFESGLLARFENPRGFSTSFGWDGRRLVSEENAENGSWTIARKRWLSWNANETSMTTAEGRVDRYFVNDDATGGQVRSVTRANGTSKSAPSERQGRTITTLRNNAVVEEQLGADPRFGWALPFVVSKRITIVGNSFGPALIQSIEESRIATAPPGPRPVVGEFDLDFSTRINGRLYRRTYDSELRTWHMTTPQGRGASIRLDQQGRPLDVDVPGLEQVRYRYDARGRLTSAEAGAGNNLRRFSLDYDGNGWPLTIEDAEQRTSVLAHDAIGRLLLQQTPDERLIGFRYDAARNLVGLTPPGRDEHVFGYDNVDRMKSYDAPLALTGQGRRTSYTYSDDGQLTEVLRPDGQQVTMTYDAQSALLKSISSTESGARPISVDGYGRLTEALHYAADYGGSLLRQVVPRLDSNSGRIPFRIQFGYDNDFRITSISVARAIDPPSGNPATYAYDGDSLLTRLTLAGRNQNFTHHPGNGLLQSSTVGGFNESWQHNAFAEPVAYTSSRSGSAQLDFSYIRDRLGRITEVTETLAGISRSTGYTYDLAGRLTEVTRDGSEIAAYSYDSNSNRSQATYSGDFAVAVALTQCAPASGPITSDVDAQDRLTRYGTCTYDYTANGELTRRIDTASGSETNYVYDEFANLRSVTLPDGTPIEYDIDGLDRRIGKRVAGQVTQTWIYKDQINPIAEYDGNGALVSVFAYAERTHVPSLMFKGNNVYKIVSDHLGSVRQVVNIDTGLIAQALDYDAWGNVLIDTNPGFQPFGYAGGLYDQDTGFIRFGARDYDPLVGRWTAKDLIGFTGSDVNLYSYALNEPTVLIDPEGERARRPNPWQQLRRDYKGSGMSMAELSKIYKATQLAKMGGGGIDPDLRASLEFLPDFETMNERTKNEQASMRCDGRGNCTIDVEFCTCDRSGVTFSQSCASEPEHFVGPPPGEDPACFCSSKRVHL